VKRILFAISVFLVGQALSAVDMPAEWDFGSRSNGAPFGHTFSVTNTASADVRVFAIVTCECLLVVPSTFTLAPGKSRKVRVSFDPKGYRGAVANGIVFRVEGGETAERMCAVKGTIVGQGPSSSEDSGCASCRIIEEDRQKLAGTQR
jgi:hypothetical protein